MLRKAGTGNWKSSVNIVYHDVYTNIVYHNVKISHNIISGAAMPFVGIGRRNLICFIREFVLNFLYNQFDKRHLKKPLPMES